jgi:hypothetical protein
MSGPLAGPEDQPLTSNRRGQRPAPPGRRPAARGQRPAARGQRPLPRGQSLYTPGASASRRSVEQASARPLAFLYQLPAWVPPIAAAALLIVGLAVRGPVGAVALVLMAGALALLAFVSWPRATAQGRIARSLAIAVALALAAWQATR